MCAFVRIWRPCPTRKAVPCIPGQTTSPTVCRSCAISRPDRPSSGPLTLSNPLGSIHWPLLFLLPTRLTCLRTPPDSNSAAVSEPSPVARAAIQAKIGLAFLDFMPKRLQKNSVRGCCAVAINQVRLRGQWHETRAQRRVIESCWLADMDTLERAFRLQPFTNRD